MPNENEFLLSAVDAIDKEDMERLVKIATKAFFDDPAQYEEIRKHASENGYFLVIKPKEDFYERHTFNFRLVITDKRETIYFGCKHGWDFPSVIEDWWGEGSERTMMKAYLFGLFSNIAKGQNNAGETAEFPVYTRRTAQNAMARLRDEFPKILSQGDLKRIENALSIDLD